ncbi:YceD family protein [Thalassolituus sp.]|uniref:YceD family protein n=1 Tax=Thalassolituus sp. TaxID=2030822 RepID=UPI0026330549|nr:YceD family protein [uncultured Thalassolituus sp.]TNC92237.1 MAG: hypothetical protein CSH36_05555 [Thalassolituus sp.]
MMSRTMTEAQIPKRVDGGKLVDVNQQLTGQIDASKLTRLSAATLRSDTPVSCNLEFDRDIERHRVLKGDCSTSVVMTCQRCLGEVTLAISSNFELGLVFNDEQAKQLPKRLEPAELTEDGLLDLWEIIEDEVLLSLPDFPMHPADECSADLPEQEETNADVKRPNPFEVLAQLKQK